MKRQFVSDLRAGVLVNDVFFCSRRDVRERRDGAPFVTFEFRDRTGSINGIMWEKIEDALNICQPGTFCRVQGRVADYQGRLQLNVNLVLPVEQNEVERKDFLTTTSYNTNELLNELRRLAASIENRPLRQLLESFLNDADFVPKFVSAPAAQSVHHAYIGGLLEHTVFMSRLAHAVSEIYHEIDRDLLLAGTILHDVGKTCEYSYETAIDHTLDGRLIGHIVLGYQMTAERIAAIPDFPVETARMLLHIILSHHGALEFGSPKTPKFAEALLVHFLDNLDARIAMFREAVNRNPGTKWTDFHQYLGTNIYIPDRPAVGGSK
ncbi:MAG: HD domain-containing protein [candidate division WOR-3 bacterium]